MDAAQNLFNQLYARYSPMVMQLCLGFVNGDRSRACDLSQEVFISTWNSLGRFKGESSYKTWLYRITVNTCLKSLRETKRKQRFNVDVPVPDCCQQADGALLQADGGELSMLYASIARLGEVDRLIIMMVLDEAEYAQIADVMGTSEGNIRVRVHRIKQNLKKLMHHEYTDR